MIGTLLIVVAITLGIETKSLLVGEGATDADHDKIVAAITGGPEVEHLIHIKTLYLGPDELLVAAKLGFAGDKPLAEVAADIDIVEARVRRAVPTARAIYFEPDVYHATRLPRTRPPKRSSSGRWTDPRGRCETGAMEYCTFTEPQQGFTYDEQLAFALATERAGFDGFFRSDHYMRMGAGRPAARTDRRLDDARRAGPRDEPHPARHAGLLGHPPGAGGARDPGRPGRRDVGRPGRARAGHRLVRSASTGRTASRSRRSGSASLEEQLAIVTGLWSHARRRDVRLRRRALHARAARPRCRSPRQDARADHRRRRRPAADARDRGALRDGVQHRLPSRARDRRGVRARAREPASGSTATRRR